VRRHLHLGAAVLYRRVQRDNIIQYRDGQTLFSVIGGGGLLGIARPPAGLRDGLRSAAGQEPYRGRALDILGPAPAPVVKVNNRYRYRVTVIGRNDKTLRGLLSAFMKEFSRRPEHKALHIYTDCNLMD